MRWMLFVHIMSVAFWLGGIATLYVLNRKAMRFSTSDKSDGIAVARDTTRSVIKGILNPSALLVLLSGIGMMVQLGLMGRDKPFWLGFMEQFGGMVALVSIAILTWQMRRLDRASSPQDQARYWRQLNYTILGIGTGVAATIFVVALRL